MGVVICLGQGGLCSPSISSFLLGLLLIFVSGDVRIWSKNYPAFAFGSQDNQAPYHFRMVNQGAQMHELKIVTPGLNGEIGTMSFESSAHPGLYLRAHNTNLYLEASDDTSDFLAHATFLVHDAFFSGFASFESADQRSHYLRHANYWLWLHAQEPSNDLYKNDASFTFGKFETCS